MDKAGKTGVPNQSQIALGLSQLHDKRWNDSSKRFGMKKRDKTGGTRVIKPFNML